MDKGKAIRTIIDTLERVAAGEIELSKSDWVRVVEFGKVLLSGWSPEQAALLDASAIPPDQMEKLRSWRPRCGQSAYKYYLAHFLSIPLAERPFAHEVRQINEPFYKALCTFMSRRQESIGELFIVDTAAIGGARIKAQHLTPQVALERLYRARERTRNSRAQARTPRP